MESGEERVGPVGQGGGELLRGSRSPPPRSGTLDSRAPAAWECRGGNRPVLSADDERGAGDPEPHQRLAHLGRGAGAPPVAADAAGGAAARRRARSRCPCPAGSGRWAPGPRGPTAPGLASPAQSEQLQELGSPPGRHWPTKRAGGEADLQGGYLYLYPLRGCTLR
ncbi:unnamed protein product [Pipistrellus nathusii]|uniref:Uncharacterized protein n=1 Tax=Pipistrellus nathusii TaxID=59473 RepID=A0ABP0AFS5_PIPNA